MAKALAEYLFGDDRHMVRVDMSEYRDGSLAVDKLIGMPRGIVGSERGGILTNQVKDNPYTVVLLDEIEKADTYVHNLFLQVFDEGWLTDGRGKKVYFSDTIIIMTSNLGSEELSKLSRPMGFGEGSSEFEPVRKAVLKAAENRFTPEFINRLDDIVVFAPLSFDEVRKIAAIYMDSIRKMMAPHGKTLEVSDAALSALARTGFSVKYGARFLKRGIDEKVKMPVTLHWKESDRFYVEEIDGEPVVITQRVTI
jgi:ATP-dependent Clp protease ATP-binding subunit ClpA